MNSFILLASTTPCGNELYNWEHARVLPSILKLLLDDSTTRSPLSFERQWMLLRLWMVQRKSMENKVPQPSCPSWELLLSLACTMTYIYSAPMTCAELHLANSTLHSPSFKLWPQSSTEQNIQHAFSLTVRSWCYTQTTKSTVFLKAKG